MSLPLALIAGLTTAATTAATVEQNRASRSAQRSMNETQVREQAKQDEERRFVLQLGVRLASLPLLHLGVGLAPSGSQGGLTAHDQHRGAGRSGAVGGWLRRSLEPESAIAHRLRRAFGIRPQERPPGGSLRSGAVGG